MLLFYVLVIIPFLLVILYIVFDYIIPLITGCPTGQIFNTWKINRKQNEVLIQREQFKKRQELAVSQFENQIASNITSAMEDQVNKQPKF